MTLVLQSTNDNRCLAQQIDRYPDYSRAMLEAFAAISERLAQLAFAHPVLFFSLATGIGPKSARTRAVRLAVAGRPLAEVSRAAGLPNCFRRLPPEACQARIEPVCWSPAADRMLGQHVPTDPATASGWLSITSYAHRACDETFAAWIAREKSLFGNWHYLSALLPVALYAWHSQNPDLPAGRAIAKTWSPRLKFKTALICTKLWIRRLRCVAGLPEQIVMDPWVAAGESGGFAFTPLLSQEQLFAEARAMNNCVASYGGLLAANISRLFSVTHRAERVATLELRWNRAADQLVISGLKGRGNVSCSPAVRKAAANWLALSPDRISHQPERRRPPTLDEMLAPYRNATSCGDPRWAKGLTLGQLKYSIQRAIVHARLQV